MTALIDLHYLPCIAWFGVALRHSALRLERYEYFVKQTYRNRCYIVTSQGVQSLHIPLLHPGPKCSVADVRIDHSQKWVNQHWRTVTAAYGKSPFFEFYGDELHRELYRRHDFLYDLNKALLTLCLKWLGAEVRIEETLAYEEKSQVMDVHAIKDFRGTISPKRPSDVDGVYNAVPYQQVFGNSFVENASVIDLIFCSGPEAGRIVLASSRVK